MKLLFLEKQDRVVALTSPPLVACIAGLFCRIKGGCLIYWVMDMNPDEAIAAGWLSHASLMARFLSFFSRLSFRESNLIIALDRYMKQRIENRYKASPDKIKVLSPWAQDGDLKPVDSNLNAFRKRHALKDKFVVMYSGNHSHCHPLETLLLSALHYENDPDLIFYFIGGGSRVADVSHFKEKYKLKNIVQLPYEPRENLSDSLSAADLHVVTMGNDYVGILHPSKIYGILSVGRPFVFVGPSESAMGDMIRMSGLGLQVDHGDTKRFVEAIEKVRAWTDDEIRNMQTTSLSFKNTHYGQKILSERLIQWIEEVPCAHS